MTSKPPPPPPTPPPSGPFIQAALICEKVLEEKDGVLSLVRVVDRLTHVVNAPSMPAELPHVQFQCVLLIMLKSGRARGRHQVEVVLEHPSGRRTNSVSTSVQLEGEERGANLIARTTVTFDAEGLYWFDVLVDGGLLTRIPFRMMYQLVSTGTRS
ncbi:MAG TPA: hypothetical protein VII57_07420 [Dehalococcoidia bacterium]